MALDINSLSAAQKEMAVKIGDAAVEAGINPDLAIAQAYKESGLKHFVGEGKERKVLSSEQNAQGVMQILPETAEAYGYEKEDLNDPEKNIKLYTKMMKKYLDKYGSEDLAVMAYHQGEGPVDEYVKTKDVTKLGPKGKQYLLDIGENYDFTGDTKDKYGDAFSPVENVEDTTTTAAGSDMPDFSKELFNVGTNLVRNYPGSIGAGVATGLGQAGMNIAREKREAKGIKPPTKPVVVNQPSAEGAPLEEQFKLEEPNMQRILQGRTEEGLTGRQRQSYNDITSARAMQRAAQEQVLDELVRQGKISPDYKMQILSRSFPTESTQSGVLYSGQRLKEEMDAMEKEKSPVQRAIEGFKQNARVAGGLPRQLVNSKVVRAMGYSPLATGVSTGAAMAHIDEARKREANGDDLGAQISRFKAISEGIGSMPVTNPYLGGLKALSYPVSLGLNAYDAWRMRQSLVKDALAKQKPGVTVGKARIE